ncbi:GDSL-type esterase/lipase family protein [Streptomyces sp. NPDC059680]|uniref:GDSL-type esterase/lipase family protein n=1 Tax=Streptomyces sp. NPDC059680 TaxID=3346904 RepID=UPI0036893B4F
MKRNRICTAVAATAAVLTCNIATAPPTVSTVHLGKETSQAKAELPTAIVSLGDSYIAGNGGRWFGNSSTLPGGRNGTDRAWNGSKRDAHLVYGASYDNDCYRSDVAEIQSVTLPVARKINLACSAAKAQNLLSGQGGGKRFKGESPQDDQLADVARTAHVKMIVVSIGGNDLGFGWLIAECMSAFMATPASHPIHCRDAAQRQVNENLPTVKTRVGSVVDDIHRVMTEAGYSRTEYRLVLQSAPAPFPRAREIRYPETGLSRAAVGGCPIWNTDADWARDNLTPEFAEAMREVADNHHADFLDLRDAFQGREACSVSTSMVGPEGPSATRSEWVRSAAIVQGDVEETIHPNAYGQRALGRCLTLTYTHGPGEYACTNTAGRDYEGMTIRGLSPVTG